MDCTCSHNHTITRLHDCYSLRDFREWKHLEDIVEQTDYPNWVMGVALAMILAGILPMPIVFLMRSFQCLQVDLDINRDSLHGNETTASTKEMIDDDDAMSPDLPPQDSLAATRFTIGDFDDDEDYSGPAMGGRVSTRSDDSDDDEDHPVTMKNISLLKSTVTGNHLTVPSSKKPFKMEIVDF